LVERFPFIIIEGDLRTLFHFLASLEVIYDASLFRVDGFRVHTDNTSLQNIYLFKHCTYQMRSKGLKSYLAGSHWTMT